MSDLEGANKDQCPIAALLRLAADGELTPEQRGRLDAHLALHPEDRERIGFEQDLRKACAKACCPGGCAPEGLRERVVACCCQKCDRPTPRSERSARDRPDWLGRSLARFGAVAALVGLVALVVFMVGRTNGWGGADPGKQFAASLAGFVRDEHARCIDGGPSLDQKFTIHEAGLVPKEFSTLVGRAVTFPCLLKAEASGLRFVDAGLCHPPGGDALHLRFRVGEEGGPGGLVSLWVQQDDGRLPLKDGVTYTWGEGCESVRFWRLDGVRYVLVCPNPQDSPCAAVALDSPAKVQPF